MIHLNYTLFLKFFLMVLFDENFNNFNNKNP